MSAPRIVMLYGRRVISDSKEATSAEEQQRRRHHAFAEENPGRRMAMPQGHPTTLLKLRAARDARLVAGLPEYELPQRAELFSAPGEAKLRAEDPELDRVCSEIQTELAHRSPDAVDRDGTSVIYDFAGARELRDRWEQAHDAAEKRAELRLVPLKVKNGDFVRINARVFQIRDVDVRRRTITTVRLDADGTARSTVSGVAADSLEPLLSRPPF
jgi:hypothetical protein